MAIEHKATALQTIEEQLASRLTAHDLAATMEVIRDVLGGYTVEPVTRESAGGSDYLEAYLTAKSIEGRSETTLARYRYVLTRALTDIGVMERQMTVYHLRSWLMDARRRGVSDITLEGWRAIVNAYFNWLQRESLISVNPCVNLGAIKCPKVVRMPYTDVEIERLKEACGSKRDKALICFLLSTGCRISEVVALNRADIDYQTMSCRVMGKGDKERVVYIDNIARMNLRRYELSRSDDSPALFVGRRSKRLTTGGVRRLLKQIGEAAGVDNVHPHRFRRTLATNLINRGMPIQEVARILGHDQLDTTMTYVYINDRDVSESYRKYS